jgi:hypothetical protein
MQREASTQDVRMDGTAIRSALKLALYNEGVTAASQIIDNEITVIDFVSRIFQTIVDDSPLSEPVKTLLSKLQIPVIKLALIDFEVFRNAQHLARKLLNGLVDLSMGTASNEEPRFARLAEIVSDIVTGFESELAPLEDPLEKVVALHGAQAEQIRKVEVKFQREAYIEARRLTAKRKVVSGLSRYAAGPTAR